MKVKFLDNPEVFTLSNIESSQLVARLYLTPRLTLSYENIKEYSDAYQAYNLYGFEYSYDEDTNYETINFDLADSP